VPDVHDETVDRTTDGTGNVTDLTLTEIRALDAGNGEKIPAFAEVIALAKESGVALLPEIKSPHLYPGIEEKMLQAITDADYGEVTIFQSFDPNSVNTLHQLDQKAQICQLYGQGVLSVTGPQPGNADRVCLMAEMVVLNPWMIQQNHEEGRQVFVWFGIIEHPLVMRFLLAMGADGLIVDDPLAMARILGR
jgi:glycerophosphoryl diester phosphodiesterase